MDNPAGRILIVDDERVIAEMLAEYLSLDCGYAVQIAASSATVVDEARAFRPHVILLDMLMPTPDGWQVAALLRAEKRTAAIPIVVVSALHRAREAAAEIGTPHYVQKPFNLNDFPPVLNRILPSGALTAV